MTEPMDDDTLEHMLKQMGKAPVALPPDLAARILEDAQSVNRARTVGSDPARWRNPLAAIGEILGGWPSIAGLATVAVAGLWIGVAQPVTVLQVPLFGAVDLTESYEIDDMMPGLDALLSEG